MDEKKNVLFLCTGNSCRSQMAEGLGKHFKSKVMTSLSAGTKKHGLNPYAIEVMNEIGIDISSQTSNTVEELPEETIDIVFTVCSDAHENCPFFNAAKIIHVGFDDPPRLTKDLNSKEEILAVYRRVRDEIKSFILNIEEYLD